MKKDGDFAKSIRPLSMTYIVRSMRTIFPPYLQFSEENPHQSTQQNYLGCGPKQSGTRSQSGDEIGDPFAN